MKVSEPTDMDGNKTGNRDGKLTRKEMLKHSIEIVE